MDWNSHEFVWLDWAVLALGILLVAWAVYRSVHKDKMTMKGADSQDYLFGKGEPWYVIGAAIFAANIGSEHLVGLAGTGAKDGVGMAHWEMQGWMILILGWLFVPFYQLLNDKMGKIITMPDFLKYLDRRSIYYFNPFQPDATPEPDAPDKDDVLKNG